MTYEPTDAKVEMLALASAIGFYHNGGLTMREIARELLIRYQPRDPKPVQQCDGSGTMMLGGMRGNGAYRESCPGCRNCAPKATPLRDGTRSTLTGCPGCGAALIEALPGESPHVCYGSPGSTVSCKDDSGSEAGERGSNAAPGADSAVATSRSRPVLVELAPATLRAKIAGEVLAALVQRGFNYTHTSLTEAWPDTAAGLAVTFTDTLLTHLREKQPTR